MSSWAILGIYKCPKWFVLMKWTQMYPWISSKSYLFTVWLLIFNSWSVNQPSNWFVTQQSFICGSKSGIGNWSFNLASQWIFMKSWTRGGLEKLNGFQNMINRPWNMFFPILEWCLHLKSRRNRKVIALGAISWM